ncbi:MAG: DUF4388 domain-containing protein [Planctomycetes bacterium]|nr:DUF4388 domain-containing protein [Planctomycetota bacterium]
MQVAQFPASAANSLIEGYCDDFVSLAAVLAQTLEQVTMRGITLSTSRAPLERIETGMRQLADAIQDLLQRQPAKPARAAPGPTPMPGAAPTPPPAPVPTPTAAKAPTPAAATRPAPTAPKANVAPTSGPGGPRAATAPQPNQPNQPNQAQQPTQPPPRLAPAAARPTPNRDLSRAATTPTPPRSGQGGASGAQPGQQPSRGGALRGNNQSMPVRSVFQFLGRMRKSGTFTIHIDHEVLTFEFQNGCVVSTTSSQGAPNERLGELLVELGCCQRAALEAALQHQDAGGERLGQFVIAERVATNGQVLEALELQVRRRFSRACECRDASYEFLEGERLLDDGRIRIAPMELNFTPST